MQIPERFWKVLTAFVGIIAILAAVFVIKELKAIGYVGVNIATTNTITVSGSGDAFSIPDIATFSFTVTANAKTVAEAQAKATTQNNLAVKAMKDGGVAEKDIQTTSYSINPHYDYQSFACTSIACPPSKSVLNGYDVSQTTLVKVRDISKAGTLLTAVGALNVENVNGLSFSVDNPDAVNAIARGKAIDQAQAKANALAKQLGVSLVRVVSFSENTGYRPPMVYAMGMAKLATADSASVAPEISTGEQKVTDSVEITYEIR